MSVNSTASIDYANTTNHRPQPRRIAFLRCRPGLTAIKTATQFTQGITMRSIIAIFAAVLAASSFAASIKGNGKLLEQTRPVADFQTIRSEGAWSLDVQVGPAPSVKVIADENLLPLIETAVQNRELNIRFKDGEHSIKLNRNSSLRIEVTVPKLTSYQHEGAGKSVFRGLSGERFAINYEGAGLITASGKVDTLSVQASGAGSLDLDELKARNATISLEGVGSIRVYASESLTAAVDGIGSLTYYGKPAKVSKAVSGIGSVQAGD